MGASSTGAATQFTDVSSSLGLSDEREPSTTSGWFDMDGDGLEEAIWVGQDGIQVLIRSQSGKLKREWASIDSPSFYNTSPFTQPVLAAGDFDKDGVRDLVVINERVTFYKRVAPLTLEKMPIDAPTLPIPLFVSDAAVGDLNMDGWPDIVLSTSRREQGHLHVKGAVDLVLMNRFGVFEMGEVTPSRRAEGHGVTLADIDEDGLIDVVESVDFGVVVGGSRILFNATEPGGATASFGTVQVYDPTGYGMGAAVEDLDGDGSWDIYNTSAGRDFLFFGLPNGRYKDRTYDVGISHRMGDGSLRIQWSPTIADFNGDGLLDIYARHDNLFIFGGPANNLLDLDILDYKPQSCLLYEQQPNGQFVRRSVPYDANDFSGGVDAVVGDANRDGRLDVLQGTVRQPAYMTIKSKAYLWVNDTPEIDGSHSVVVTLRGTVGADPPTGAVVTATCEGNAVRRLLTSGGKMGALSGSTVHAAWPACDGDVDLVVSWPSGITSSHSVTDGARSVVIDEPQWLEIANEEGGWKLRLQPQLVSDANLCVRNAETQDWECCEESCERTLHPILPTYDRVRAGENGPEFALPSKPFHVTLTTDPVLPFPEQAFTVRVRRTHPLVGFTDDADIWLRVGGEKVAWTESDNEAGIYEAQVDGGSAGKDVGMTVFADGQIALKASIPNGYNIDPRTTEYLSYPTQAPPPDRGYWRVLFTPGRELHAVAKQDIGATLTDGKKVPAQVINSGTGRLALQVPWESIDPGTGIIVHDKEIPRSQPLKAVRTETLSDFLPHVVGVDGYFARNDMVEGGDSTVLYLTLVDEDGRPLPPVAEAIVLESDDLVIASPLVGMGRNVANWDLRTVIRTKQGTGIATLRVRRTDGVLLREFAIPVRGPLGLPISEIESSIELSQESIPAGVGATTQVRVYARNEWKELVGLDAAVRAETQGPLRILGPVTQSDGHVSFEVEPSYFGGAWPIDIYLNDTYFDSVTVTVIGPALPTEKPTVTWPESEDVISSAEIAELETQEAGCGIGGGTHSLLLLTLVLSLLFFLVRKRTG